MANLVTWEELLILMADAEVRDRDAIEQECCRWRLLEESARLSTARLIKECLMFTTRVPTLSVPDPPEPPVLPPDDRHAPDIGREPSIDPPPTTPDQDAPGDDPRRPPSPGWTT